MRRLILLAFIGCAGLFAAVVLTGPAHGDLLPTLTLPTSHGPAASALAASATAATLATSATAATSALATASAASATASTAFAACGASTSPGRPASAGRLATWRRAVRNPGSRGCDGQRAAHRGGPAFGTGSQRSRYEDALLRTRPGSSPWHGDQLPAQAGG